MPEPSEPGQSAARRKPSRRSGQKPRRGGKRGGGPGHAAAHAGASEQPAGPGASAASAAPAARGHGAGRPGNSRGGHSSRHRHRAPQPKAVPVPAKPVPVASVPLTEAEISKYGGSGPASGACSLRQKLVSELSSGRYECAVCMDHVLPSDPVWSCGCCYRVLHLACIQDWRTAKGAAQPHDVWTCPGCNAEQKYKPANRCFCGSQVRPELQPGIVPHACGGPCRRAGRGCAHPCPLPCHPGPCPPCAAMAPPQQCACGKTSLLRRCAASREPAVCGKVCGRPLGCSDSSHTCQALCHEGPCQPCDVHVSATCFCGSQCKDTACPDLRAVASMPCASGAQLPALRQHHPAPPPGLDQVHQPAEHAGTWEHAVAASAAASGAAAAPRARHAATPEQGGRGWSCEQPCGRPLDCACHTCTRPCHAGSCSSCQRMPGRVHTCPCGAKPLRDLAAAPQLLTRWHAGSSEQVLVLPRTYKRTSCLDPQLCCGAVCGRMLPCGHTCSSRCHEGACPPCATPLAAHCACGAVHKSLTCAAKTKLAGIQLPRHLAREAADGKPAMRTALDQHMACGHVCKMFLSCTRHVCMRTCCQHREAAMVAAAEEISAAAAGSAAGVGQARQLSRQLGVAMRSGRRRRGMRRVTAEHAEASAQQSAAVAAGAEPYVHVPGGEVPNPEGQGPGHMCVRTCTRMLACGLHTCDDMCHAGPCKPCAHVSRQPLVCDCGATVVQPPVRCGTTLPPCNQPCSKRRACGHAHPSWHTCHEGPCPPCGTLVEKQCAGMHTKVKVPCATPAERVQCGARCGLTLACGEHLCGRMCHGGPCTKEGEPLPAPGSSCGNPCGRIRDCGHPCEAPCHPGQPCPDVPCRGTAELACPCGRMKADVQCLRGAVPGEAWGLALRPEVQPAGAVVVAICGLVETHSHKEAQQHAAAALGRSGDGSDLPLVRVKLSARERDMLLQSRALPCDATCESAARARAMGQALGIMIVARPGQEEPGAWGTSAHVACPYDAAILTMGAQQPVWASKVDQLLRDFAAGYAAESEVLAAKGGVVARLSRDGRALNFVPAPQPRRAFLHSLAEAYGLAAESLDLDPQRHVRVTKPAHTPSTSHLAVYNLITMPATCTPAPDLAALADNPAAPLACRTASLPLAPAALPLPRMTVAQAVERFAPQHAGSANGAAGAGTGGGAGAVFGAQVYPGEPTVQDMHADDVGRILLAYDWNTRVGRGPLQPPRLTAALDRALGAGRGGPPRVKVLDDRCATVMFASKGEAAAVLSLVESMGDAAALPCKLRWWGVGLSSSGAAATEPAATAGAAAAETGAVTRTLGGAAAKPRLGPGAKPALASRAPAAAAGSKWGRAAKPAGGNSWSALARAAIDPEADEPEPLAPADDPRFRIAVRPPAPARQTRGMDAW